MDAGALGVVAAAGGVLGVAGLIGGTAAFLRSGYAKRTTELWKEEAEALGKRLETVEAQEGECKAENAKLRTELEVLRDQVTGKTAIDELGRQMAEQNALLLEAMNAHVDELLAAQGIQRRPRPAPVKRPTKTTARSRR